MPAIKLVFLLAILAAGAVGGALPLLRQFASHRLLTRGNALAAGIFLGAGWMHMLPEAAKDWRALTGSPEWAFVLAAVGFLVMLAAEHVLLPENAHALVHAPSSDRFGDLAGQERSNRAAYAVGVALSVHAILEGLALGAEPALPSASVLFVAIFAHKLMAGFALGASLARSAMAPPLRAGLLAVFAGATPVGILLGAAPGVGLDGSLRQGLEAAFLALAAGTFVYVALIDILRDEPIEPGSRFTHFGLVSLGAAAMGLLSFWV